MLDAIKSLIRSHFSRRPPKKKTLRKVKSEPLSRSNSVGASGYSLSSCETPLSRSDSGMSSSSSVSSASSAASLTLAQDRKDVINDVLRFFDAAYLAPKNSPMFRRQFVKGRKGQRRRLKQRPDLVVKMFKRLVKVPLRKLLGDSYHNDYDLVARYELAAEKVVKRRRSNHVQSWRSSARCLPLRYGGVLGVCPITGSSVLDVSDVAHYETDSHVDLVEEDVSKGSAPPMVKRKLKVDDSVPEKVESMRADFDDVPQKSCSSCSKKLSPSQIFPKDADSWGSDVKKTVFCADCWDQHVQKKLMPLMEERKKQEAEGTTVTQKPCKCGSLTHKTTRHRDCPLNKRNLCVRVVPKKTTPPATPQTTTPPKETTPQTTTPPKATTPQTTNTPPQVTTTQTTTPPKARGDETDEYTTETDVGAVYDLGSTTENEDVMTVASQVPIATESEPESNPKPKRRRYARRKRVIYRPKVGDNVLAQYKMNQWYLAQVTHSSRGLHTVYFLEDGEVMEYMTNTDVRPVKNSLVPTRGEMIGRQFIVEDEDDISVSRWKVDRSEGNEFVCVRLGDKVEGEVSITNFDIGYVTFTWMRQMQKMRETGPEA